MKYSLLEVFGLSGEKSSQTLSLMESYGLSPTQLAPEKQPRPSVTDVIREAIETGTVPLLEEREPSSTDTMAQRDDIALRRWREMAGLED